MKILHVAETIRGGIATYFDEVVSHQVDEFGEDNVRLLVPSNQVHELESFPHRCIVGFDRPGRVRGLPRLASSYSREIHRFDPDVVHLHSTFAGVVGRLLSMTHPRRGKIVYCPHGWAFDMEAPALNRWVFKFVERLLSFRAARIIAISQHEYDQALSIGISRDKAVLIESGIELTPPECSAADWPALKPKVLFVGRLDYQKGFDVLLEAIKPIAAELSVRVVGDYVTNDRRGEFVIPPGIEMLGWLKKRAVTSQLMASDLVVIPSRWEGFGLVALEAMRCGKAVVASRVGGLSSIVVQSETGLLVEPGNADELRLAIIESVSGNTTRLGLAGLKRFRSKYTSDKVNERLVQIYRDDLPSMGSKADGRVTESSN